MPVSATRDPQWQRLADAVRRRRGELGYLRRPDWPATKRLDRRQLRAFEEGNRTTDSSRIAALEADLEWAPGSVVEILNGGEPTPLNAKERAGQTLESDRPVSDTEEIVNGLLLVIAKAEDLTPAYRSRLIEAVRIQFGLAEPPDLEPRRATG